MLRLSRVVKRLFNLLDDRLPDTYRIASVLKFLKLPLLQLAGIDDNPLIGTFLVLRLHGIADKVYRSGIEVDERSLKVNSACD